MTTMRAAVMREANKPLTIETVELGPIKPDDVLVKIAAASICHTDLEVLEGQLKYPMPMILGHEAAGTISAVGANVTHLSVGDPVALHWNPHCGHCYYCDHEQPILCSPYTKNRSSGRHYDGEYRHTINDDPVHMLMYLGGFAEYAIVPAQSAVKMPDGMPLDRACLLGCGVMTGFGAATHTAKPGFGETAVIIGCGAIGLSAVQGARMSGAGRIVALDFDDKKLEIAKAAGATDVINPKTNDAIAFVKELTSGRGGDVVYECAGSERAFQDSVKLCRAGGQVVWLGKVNVDQDVSFKWGTLMGERKIVRSSYGGARPAQDFPAMARAYLDGDLKLDDMITGRITLDEINDGFDLLHAGKAIRTVIMF